MTSWTAAHRIAQIQAVRALDDLGLDRAERVDVFGAILRAGVILCVRPMPKLFGAYQAAPGDPIGILVNADLDETTQRHTAAHELGHHVFGHTSTVDGDLEVLGKGRPWPTHELLAEAFAAWFLMPRRAVRRAMERLGVTQVRTPEEVYRIALLLGTSYRGTARHLQSLHLATAARAKAWTGVPVGKVKDQLDTPGPQRNDRRSNVWLLDRRLCGHGIHAERGDRLIIQLPAAPGGAAWRLTLPSELAATSAQNALAVEGEPGPGRRFVVDISLQAPPATYTVSAEAQDVDHGDSWHVHINVASPRRGVLFP
jgi:hypothetical protein